MRTKVQTTGQHGRASGVLERNAVFFRHLGVRVAPLPRGKRGAWISVIGFASVVFTYFGVNYLLSGLHSYAN